MPIYIYGLIIKAFQNLDDGDIIMFRNIPKLKAYLESQEITVDFDDNIKFNNPNPPYGTAYFENDLIKIFVFEH